MISLRFKDKYFATWMRIIGMLPPIKTVDVDFKQPWWRMMTQRMGSWALVVVCEATAMSFYTLTPMMLGHIFDAGSRYYFVYFLIGWATVIFVEWISGYMFIRLLVQGTQSLHYSACRFFLTVDPLAHITRRSGALFAKIDRAADSYDDFADIVSFELVGVIVSISTVIISFLSVDIKLGLITLLMLFIVCVVNVSNVLIGVRSFDRHFIATNDDFRSSSMEVLTQINLVRSTFASNELDAQVQETNNVFMKVFSAAWTAYITMSNLFTRILYLVSIVFIGFLILKLMQQNVISSVTATAMIVTYIHGTSEIIRIGRRINKLALSVSRISDLFNYIRNFGKQTFPVLSGDVTRRSAPTSLKNQDPIVVHIDHMHFSYPEAQIFHNQSMYLEVPRAQENKMYGIIGPSGVGKTTLISILGGQIAPTKGSVTINGLSLYEVDDTVRRLFVALQGQQASNVRGTVRDNLLLGIPRDREPYGEGDLIDVLKRVGLWHIFQQKNGLDARIGESGLNLSGGQKQRLNFASLYLRARLYKPVLILIDEPTSSLDEVSEEAITIMIEELARDAVTLVIAHRLHTLERATRILDCSLLSDQKEITFYTRQELMEISDYYRRLVSGDLTLEEQ